MPRRDGWELLQRLSTPRFRRMSRVVLTASPLVGDHDRALALGADEVVVKPASFGQLLRVVEGLRGYLHRSDSGLRPVPAGV